jgi:hypothetical protein
MAPLVVPEVGAKCYRHDRVIFIRGLYAYRAAVVGPARFEELAGVMV